MNVCGNRGAAYHKQTDAVLAGCVLVVRLSVLLDAAR